MCNLNILIKKRRSKIDYSGFLMSVSTTSYNSNKDADGVFFNKGGKEGSSLLVKSKKKIDYCKYRKLINKSNVIFSHQRISTSGHSAKYNQPFEAGGFIFAHNGICYLYSKNGHSDTYNMFKEFRETFTKVYKKLNKKYNISEKRLRDRCISKSIKIMFKEVIGSWSIGIYDKVTERFYYFKNSSTTIHAYDLGESIYITTNNSNENFIPMVLGSKKITEYEIKDRMVYRVEEDNIHDVCLNELGEIEEKVYNYNKDHSNNLKNYNDKVRNNYRSRCENFKSNRKNNTIIYTSKKGKNKDNISDWNTKTGLKKRIKKIERKLWKKQKKLLKGGNVIMSLLDNLSNSSLLDYDFQLSSEDIKDVNFKTLFEDENLCCDGNSDVNYLDEVNKDNSNFLNDMMGYDNKKEKKYFVTKPKKKIIHNVKKLDGSWEFPKNKEYILCFENNDSVRTMYKAEYDTLSPNMQQYSLFENDWILNGGWAEHKKKERQKNSSVIDQFMNNGVI